jgi:ABC-type histidine transport system ATPase subunit
LRCLDIVMTAKYAALEPWWHRYDDADAERARTCLDRMGVAWLAERAFATTSSGEQQRVLLRRTLMNDPAVLLLDEAECAARPRRPRAPGAGARRVDDRPVGTTAHPRDSSPGRGATGE